LQIPSELHDAFISAVEKGNIRTMPNRSMPADPHPTPGALLMGDAFNMRHPLTGGGMTVALSDIVVLTDLLKPLRNLNDAASLSKYLESFYTLRKVSFLNKRAVSIVCLEPKIKNRVMIIIILQILCCIFETCDFRVALFCVCV
jgi:flavin-dependent dehydrogenase